MELWVRYLPRLADDSIRRGPADDNARHRAHLFTNPVSPTTGETKGGSASNSALTIPSSELVLSLRIRWLMEATLVAEHTQ